jgi:hypothetical protein
LPETTSLPFLSKYIFLQITAAPCGLPANAFPEGPLWPLRI